MNIYIKNEHEYCEEKLFAEQANFRLEAPGSFTEVCWR